MPQKVKNIYDGMSHWENLVEAEAVATRRKSNYGVANHIEHRIANLCEIQQLIINRQMYTEPYQHMRRRSGQNKMRDIAKTRFHPTHIQHQSLVMAIEPRLEKAFIHDTYASRKGKGQTHAALRVKQWLVSDTEGTRWAAHLDICKFYDSIQHCHIRSQLERICKDKEFNAAFMEPSEAYAPSGKAIPLGNRPSQLQGNMALMPVDREAKEHLRIRYYLRYLDDIIFFGPTKADVWHNVRKLRKFIHSLGYRTHEPQVVNINQGLDTLGYVFYKHGSMMWRKSNKKKYLRRRAKVTNRKRLRELDDAAWGMLKWGNKHCKRLYRMTTGISMEALGIKREQQKDKNGTVIIDAPKISMSTILNSEVEVTQIVDGIKTSMGEGRMALKIIFFGKEHKLIVNAAPVKAFMRQMLEYKITRFKTVLIDRGGMRYDIDTSRTVITEINGREITEVDGKAVYADTKTPVDIQ